MGTDGKCTVACCFSCFFVEVSVAVISVTGALRINVLILFLGKVSILLIWEFHHALCCTEGFDIISKFLARRNLCNVWNELCSFSVQKTNKQPWLYILYFLDIIAAVLCFKSFSAVFNRQIYWEKRGDGTRDRLCHISHDQT